MVKMISVIFVGLMLMGFSLLASAEPVAGTTKTESKTGIQFVWVPSGCFMMGSNDGIKNEQPVHKVCFKKGFWMGKYEVTQAQHKKLMDMNPSEFKGDPTRPVEKVTWPEARDYADEMSYVTSDKYRLPSEAEWEYACKAGRDSTYCGPGGKVARLGWYAGNSEDTTHAVGGKRPNDWGLYDMSGNVLEWTQDCANDNYSGAPENGSVWKSGDCSKRVIRGGSWSGSPDYMRAAYRVWLDSGSRYIYNGFRLVKDR